MAARRGRRTRQVWLTTALALGAWALSGCGEAEPAAGSVTAGQRPAAAVREAAPDFELPGLDGSKRRLSDYRGQVVVLNFWATWCGPCRIEAPSLQRLYAAGADFELLAVSVDARSAPVESFVAEYGLRFPVLLDSDRAVATRYGVTGIPATFLIDRQGRIAVRVEGTREWDAPSWREAVARLAQE